MIPPTYSKPKPPKQQHSWYANKKREYATDCRLSRRKGRDEPPVDPRQNNPFSGLKPASTWISCKQDAAEVAEILKKKEAANV
jgi:hypothetical protein